MNYKRRKGIIALVVASLCSFSQAGFAVLFEPGVGVGIEYTDNATLVKEKKVNDFVVVGYAGARISENEGALTYDATATSNNTNYAKKAFPDQRYFNLGAGADWAMIRGRFNWFLRDIYNQRTINALNTNTPDNLQNSNIFSFGANILFPVSARQNFSLIPMFSQYYYEAQPTDNKRVSLAASWTYEMFRLTSVGFNLSVRSINYTEKNILGQSIEDTTFTNAAIVFSGQRLRSVFSANLGSTNVKRKNGQETTAFAGFFNWLADLSSRSKFETRLSTDLTDTGRVDFTFDGNPGAGNGDGVQITTDVIRNSYMYMAYLREDSSFKTNVSVRYRKVKYSESPLDRIIRGGGVQFSYPVSQLLSSGTYANYNRIKQLDTNRLDKQFTVGASLNYVFTRKIRGLLDLKYRRKESTLITENYEEYSIFVSLVYGYGGINRPTRAGGF